jgi:UDP-2-acetamido-3-amino-2,3-dideoxy-glucuronate N-acetyltransferase
MNEPSVHSSAFVAPNARLGSGTKIWHLAQVREGAILGDECIVGKGAYVGENVRIGNRVKIQNNASVYSGAELEDGVFVGPNVCLTNDRFPRSINPDGGLKGSHDWVLGTIRVRTGAALGAGAVIVTGVTIGRWALVGAGAVVVNDVPDYGLAVGNPARVIGHVCACAHGLRTDGPRLKCSHCGAKYDRDANGAVRPSDDKVNGETGLCR